MLFFHLAVIGLIFTPRLFLVYSPRNRSSAVGQKLEKLEISAALSWTLLFPLLTKALQKQV